MRRLAAIFTTIVVWTTMSYGQVPDVDAVQRIVSHPFTTVVISGSGFSNNIADLQVWFGNVKGTITSASLTTLEVTVPAQARLSNVEVVNLVSGRSGRSPVKFTPNFNGDPAAFSGTNFSSQYFPWSEQIFDLCSCDLDGNGKTDLVGTKFQDNAFNNEMMLMVNTSTVGANNTTLQFSSQKLTSPQSTYSVTCGDLNGDGKPELVATRGGSITSTQLFIYPNTSTPGNVAFGPVVTLNLDAGELGKEILIRDLNLDGKSDIIVSNGATTNTLYIFQNGLTSSTITADGFTTFKKVLSSSTGGLEVQDFNNDGWPDIATVPFSSGKKLFIIINPASGSADFSGAQVISSDISGSFTLRDLASADFNNDGWMDLVVSDFAAHRSFVLINRKTTPLAFANVSGTFGTQKAWGVDVADMNGDGLADFIVHGQDVTNAKLDVFVNNGSGGFTQTSLTPPKAGWNIKVGDYDGDSKPDIAATVTDGVSAFGMHIYKNTNCHVPVILNTDPIVICNGQTIDVNAVPLQGVAFTWSSGDTGPTASITFSDNGTLTVTATGEGGACAKQASITVSQGVGSQPATPTIDGPTGICAGNTLVLSTSAVADGYLWGGPNEFTSTVQNPAGIPNVTTANSGVYTLQVKAGDCLSEIATKTVTVVEPTAFSISANPGAQVCSGQPVTLSVASDANYNYQWKKGGSNITGATNASYVIVSAAAANEGSYTVAISHKTIACSSETSAFALDILTAPVASFTTVPATVCVGTEVTFTSTSTVDNAATVSYNWTFGDGAIGSGSPATHTYLSAQAITANLTVSYGGLTGCSNGVNVGFNVSTAIPPAITVQDGAVEICGNGTENLTLTVTPGNLVSYTWTPSGSGASITVSAPGTYSVETVDANGCVGNAEVVLAEDPACQGGAPIVIEAMKVFTPNGDGSNDYWEIKLIENYPGCRLSVFDGRGMRVYETDAASYPITGWDGVSGGKPVPDGTYYFVLGCADRDKPFTGSVLILR